MDSYHIPQELLLQWHVTERCNLRCAHCYQESYSRGELGFQDLLRILQQFRDALDVWNKKSRRLLPVRGHVTVTGGEPFVRDDFLELLDILAGDRDLYSFAILTNGHFIDSRMARRLSVLGPDFVQVSIEGTETSHDRIRGSGSFARTCAAIKSLVRQGVRTFISFTAHRGNYREFSEVARLGQRLGVARVWADRLIPNGSGSNLSDEILTPEETREFIEIMYKASFEAKGRWFNNTEIAMHRALEFLVAGGAPYHCAAGDTLITVVADGDVYPCRRMPIRVGNLLETPLVELYQQSEVLTSLRDPSRFGDGCQDCCYMKLCRGGLRCLSHAVYSNPFKADPGCWLARH